MGEQYKGFDLPHNVIIEGRRKISVSGVTDMESFDEAEIVLGTTAGTLILRGQELHIDKLTLDSGEVSVNGLIEQLDYEEAVESTGLFSRFFK